MAQMTEGVVPDTFASRIDRMEQEMKTIATTIIADGEYGAAKDALDLADRIASFRCHCRWSIPLEEAHWGWMPSGETE